MKNLLNIRILLVAAFVALFCCACSMQPKAKISSLLFNKTLTCAYLDNKAFTGSAWSEDEKTVCINFEEGRIASVMVYHENGEVAIKSTSLVGESETFDENGNAIGMQEFLKNYPLLLKAIMEMGESLVVSQDLK